MTWKIKILLAAAVACGFVIGNMVFSSPSSGERFCSVLGSLSLPSTPGRNGREYFTFAGPADPSLNAHVGPAFSVSSMSTGPATVSAPKKAGPVFHDLDISLCALDMSSSRPDVPDHEDSAAGLEELLDAIARVESNGSADAVGDGGQAVGAYQLRPVFLKDINRIIGCKKYTLADRWDPVKSRQMARIFFGHYSRGKDQLEMARQFNGGPVNGLLIGDTLVYALKIGLILY